jgi:carbamoyl-phosphate synthase large subunit
VILVEAKVRKEGLPKNREDFLNLKRMGFADKRLAKITGQTEKEVRELRCALDLNPIYKRVDSCAAEFDSVTSYMYSTYEE